MCWSQLVRFHCTAYAVCEVPCLSSLSFLILPQNLQCYSYSGFCLVSERANSFLLFRSLFYALFTWLLSTHFPCLGINVTNSERSSWQLTLKQRSLFCSCMVFTIFLHHTYPSYCFKLNCLILCYISIFLIIFLVPWG